MKVPVELEIDADAIPVFEQLAKDTGCQTWQHMLAIVAQNAVALEFKRRLLAYPDFPPSTPGEFKDLTAWPHPIPVTERLPDKDTEAIEESIRVLAFCDYWMDAVFLFDTSEWCRADYVPLIGEVTHWLPMPPPPVKE